VKLANEEIDTPHAADNSKKSKSKSKSKSKEQPFCTVHVLLLLFLASKR